MRHRYISIILASALLALSAHAAPDAGSISKDIEKQLDKQKPSTYQKPSTSKDEQTQDDDKGVKVLVDGFKFSGNTLVSNNEINLVLKSFIGKRQSFSQLQDATRTIADYYRDRGYSARAFLPPQEVKDGVVEIIILEGKLSAIEIDAEATKRLDKDRAKKTIETSHPIGNTLETSKLERGLMLLNDTPGVSAASSLVAGENAGDSKLKVKLQDAPLLDASVILSNTGSKSTGDKQIMLSSSVNSPFGIGDQITLSGMATEGIRFAKMGYTMPVGYSGARAGVNASKMTYRVVDGSANSDGSSTSLGLTTSYPIVRSSSKNITLSANADSKTYLNYVNQIVTSDKTNKQASITLSGSNFDSNGQTAISATFTTGILSLKNAPTDYATDQATANTDGKFSKLNISLTRYQSIKDDLSAMLTLNYQKSNKNLDSGEKLYLGGSSGVRAYPNNEAGGDEGYVATAELTKTLPLNLSATLFYDYGHIIQHHNLYSGWQGSSIADNEYDLKGYGAYVSYQKGSVSAKATVAWRAGDNPNPVVSTGKDNDGTKSTPRVWLQMVKVF